MIYNQIYNDNDEKIEEEVISKKKKKLTKLKIVNYKFI